MAEALSTKEQKKVIRALTRLKHSIRAEREIDALMDQRDQVGSEGVVPRLETTLAELLSQDGS